MAKLRILVGLCAALALALALAVSASSAAADPFEGPPICASAGTAISGIYADLTITGNEYVKSGTNLTVLGNLTVAPGACLDAFTLGTVHVSGNVLVGKGAILALGCSPGALGPFPPCGTTTTNDSVGGNIVADQPLTMYLTAVTVHGNVASFGGGPGPVLSPYVNFPIKENIISGNLYVSGWQGAWFGVLRNTIDGSAILLNNVGVTISEETNLPDSTEIVTNKISGDLICFGNVPAAQYGDSGGRPNRVGGRKIGQCTAV
jgi:hypothetical protein